MGYQITNNSDKFSADISRIKLYFAGSAILLLLVITIGSFAIMRSPATIGSVSQAIKQFIQYEKYRGDYLSVAVMPDANNGTSTDLYAKSIPVLVYHGILPTPDTSTINLTTETFKEQMFALKRNGYNTIDETDMLAFMRGEKQLPAKSFLLTFDDGRRDSYENADPILKTVGFKATMFVITKYSVDPGISYYINYRDLKSMDASGRWSIEAHTNDGHNTYPIDNTGKQGHYYSDRIWLPDKQRVETEAEYAARTYNDLLLTKQKIESVINKNVIAFAFPFGDYGQETSNYIYASQTLLDNVSKIYPLAYYQNTPGVRFTANYPIPSKLPNSLFLVRRIDASQKWTGNDIIKVMKNSNAKNLPYTDPIKENNGWIPAWGSVHVEPGIMTIESSTSTAGGAAILDGSRLWQNYEVKASILAPEKSTFLWLRYQDDDNNAGCNYGANFVHIEETVNGVKKVIKGVIDPPGYSLPAKDLEILATVSGRTVACYLNGKKIVSSDFLNPVLDTGGIGFKVWDSNLKHSSLYIKNISVNPIQ